MSGGIPPLIVMGVSGSGKTTVGRLLAHRLGVPFLDADDLHPPANKQKMAAGMPLDEADRAPWLRSVAARIAAAADGGGSIVVACSALRRAYRDVLVSAAPHALFVHLVGAPETIGDRQARRTHEFMPASLLASQIATLESLQADERGLVMDLTHSPEEIVAAVLDHVRGGRAGSAG